MRLLILTTFLINNILGYHYSFNNRRPPPPSPYPPENKNLEPSSPPPVQPPFPPGVPLNACKTFIPNLCDSLFEPNYFDKNCFSNDDLYGGLGCNAGGLICCRFCEFSQYKEVPCIKSPNLPPFPPPLPSLPPSPLLPPFTPPPNNPLIIQLPDKVINPDNAKINFHMRIRSTIESFDKTKFISKFKNIFKREFNPKKIKLYLRPGSLILDISITTNLSIVENTSKFMTTFTPNVLSEKLNISIIEISTPQIITFTEDKKFKLNKVYYFIPLLILFLVLISLFYKKYRTKKKLYNSDCRLSGLENYKKNNSRNSSTETFNI